MRFLVHGETQYVANSPLSNPEARFDFANTRPGNTHIHDYSFGGVFRTIGSQDDLDCRSAQFALGNYRHRGRLGHGAFRRLRLKL